MMSEPASNPAGKGPRAEGRFPQDQVPQDRPPENTGSDSWCQPFSCELLSNSFNPPGHAGKHGRPEAKRFSVYRNNIHHGLLEALAATYPSTLAILGEARFRDAAIAFLRQHPPRSAVMAGYGAEFPGFVASLPRFVSAPFLGDLARLEFAWLESYHACDSAPLVPEELLAIPGEDADGACFTPHPAARLVISGHAIFDLFSARDAWPLKLDDPEGFSTDTPQAVLVTRPGLEVLVQKLESGDAAFIAALMDGQPIVEAIRRATATNAKFDPGTSMALCLERGVFNACYLNGRQDRSQSQTGK